jgi:8-oxo-dGTP diphosphatase
MIEAAGGLLWLETEGRRKLAVVHRARYGDWALPKGKLKLGELPEDAALREVFEETGCLAELGPFAGETRYDAGGQSKVVKFWHMNLVRMGSLEPNEEVDAVQWISPEEAVKQLDYPGEARLVQEAAIGI